jgi:hypothetical protein
MENPFWYRTLGVKRGRWRRLSLLALGPLVLISPTLMTSLTNGHWSQHEQLRLSLFFYVAFVCLRGLMSTVGTVSQERERGTWEILYSAGMSPASLFRSMWSAQVLPLVLEVLLVLPWIWEQWKEPGLLLFFPALMLFAASLGLFASVRFASSFQAAQFAYGWLGLGVATAFMGWIWGELGQRRSLIYDSLWSVNPWSQALEMSDGEGIGWAWVLIYLLVAGFLRWSSQAWVGRPVVAQAFRGRPRRPSENPLIYRNHSGWSSRRLAFIYLAVVSVCAQLHNEMGPVCALMWHTAFWLILVTHGNCQALCREKEQGSLQALLATKLSLADITWGLWRQGVVPLLVLQFFLSLPFLLILKGGLATWVLIALVSFLSTAAWGALSLSMSLRSKSTLKAFQTLYLMLGFLGAGTLFVDICLLDPLFGVHDPLLSLCNPLLSLIYLGLEKPRGGKEWLDWCWLICSVSHLGLWVWASSDLKKRLQRGQL